MVLFSPAVVTVFAPGFLDEPEKFDLTVRLTRWMAPYLLFIGLAAFSMGILNTFQKFALPAAAPVLLNVCDDRSGRCSSLPCWRSRFMGLAFGVLAGGVLQVMVQLPETLRQRVSFHLATFNRKHPGGGEGRQTAGAGRCSGWPCTS